MKLDETRDWARANTIYFGGGTLAVGAILFVLGPICLPCLLGFTILLPLLMIAAIWVAVTAAIWAGCWVVSVIDRKAPK